MKIFMGNRVLAGGQNESQEPFDVELVTTGLLQISQTLRASAAKVFDRGNRTTRLRFSVRRQHVSNGQATDFLLTHASTLSNMSDFVTLISENPGGQTYYLCDASIQSIHGFQENNATQHAYEILGGSISNTSPALNSGE